MTTLPVSSRTSRLGLKRARYPAGQVTSIRDWPPALGSSQATCGSVGLPCSTASRPTPPHAPPASQLVVGRANSPPDSEGFGDGGNEPVASETNPQPPAPLIRPAASSRTIQPLLPAPQAIGGKLGAGPAIRTNHRRSAPLPEACIPGPVIVVMSPSVTTAIETTASDGSVSYTHLRAHETRHD